MSDRLLVFDIEGRFAHFRKGYTTTSPLTYDFPPRTVVIGMLGAILGYEEKRYIDEFSIEKCRIGVKIINPGYKIRIKENWREGPGGKAEIKNVSQVGLEVLREPSYRIYLYHIKDDIFNELQGYIQDGRSIYNPYLGIREFLCKIKYINTYDFDEQLEDRFIEIASIIPESLGFPYSSEDIDDSRLESFVLRKDTVPNQTLSGREFRRIRVLYEINGKSLFLKPKREVIYIHNLNERIMFLE